MTSKTKYIVIVLLLVVLASTSVGLSTWNIHYQATIGEIKYDTDPSTVDSLLNDYIYFETTTDPTGNAVLPTKQSYPIGIDEDGNANTQDTFTYTYDGNSHTPAVFAPFKDAENEANNKQKGDANYPAELFLNDNVIDTGWGLGEAGGIFSEITFKREYRLVALPYVSDHKGNSDNYCEISSVAYFEDIINVFLTWKNGNKGNNTGTNVVVHFVKEDGIFLPYILDNDVYVPYSSVENSKIKQASYNSATQELTVQVNGFSAFTISATEGGWTETAPTDAGVYQCRFTAVKGTLTDEEQIYYNGLTAEEKVAFDNAAQETVGILNNLDDNGTAYAAQVTYAIAPYQTEMADLTENSFTYGEKASTVKAAPRTNLTSGTMPLATDSTETAAESGLTTINNNTNSFYVTYGGASFEIQIFSTFKKLDGRDYDVDFSTELLNIAKSLKDTTNIGSEYYTTYGYSPDPNYQISNPKVHYTILRREITINSWSSFSDDSPTSTVYNGTAQSPEVTSYTSTYGAELAYSWTNGTKTFTTAQKDAGSYTVSAYIGGEGAGNYFLSCAEGAGTPVTDENGEVTKVNWTYEITPKEVDITWTNIDNLVYNGEEQAPTATATNVIAGDTVNVTVTGKQTNAGTGYTAIADSLDNSNYKLPDTKPTQAFEIQQKEVGITWTNIDNLVYNGEEQAPTATATNVIAGDTVNVTVTGKQTNAGAGYTATADSLDNSNYKLPDTKPTTSFSIAQKSVTLTWENTLLTYSGSAQGPTAFSKDVYATDDCSIVVDGQGITVGQYNASATLAGTDAGNYKLTNASETFTISQAPNSITWTTTPGWTYGQTPVAAAATTAFGGNVTITYYTTYNTSTQSYSGEIAFDAISNAGTYYVVATSESDPNGNYFGTSQDIAGGFVVAKAENAITFANGYPKGWTYGNKPANETDVVSATALDGTVTFTYYTDSACTTAIAFADIVNAGTYYVKAVSADGTNHYASSATKQLVVAKANYDMSGISFVDASFEYTGQPINIAITGTLPTGVSVSYVNNGKTNVSESGSIVTANFATSDSNYNVPESMTATLTITRKPVAKPTHNGDTYTYTGASQEDAIVADFTYDSTAMTMSLPSNLTDASNNKNITFKLDGNHCWTDGQTNNVTITIVIAKLQVYVDSIILNCDYGTNPSGVSWDTIAANVVANTSVASGTKLVGTIKCTNTTDSALEELEESSNITVGNTYKITYTVASTNNIEFVGDAYCYLKYKTAKIGDNWYTVEDAIAQANSTATSSAKVQITFAGNASTEDSHVTTAFTLLKDETNLPNCTGSFTLNYIEFVVPHSATLSWGDNKWVDVSTPTASSGNVYAAVQIPQEISLTFNNGSVLAVTAALGYTNNWTKACNRGVLLNDGTITIKSSSNVYAYGYIKSSLTRDENNNIIVDADNAPVITGKITAESGSTVVEAMTLFDYPGGNSVSKIMGNAFPSNAWIVHNISCTLQINAGTTYQGYVMVVASNAVQSTFATILGANSSVENCLFKPAEASPDEATNYIVKSTRPARTWTQTSEDYLALYTIKGSNSVKGQRDTFEIYGSYTDDVLSVTVSGQTLQTSTTISAPIGYMDIVIKNGANLSLTSSDYAILPGSKLVIEENANVTIGSNIDVALIDLATMEGWLSVSNSNKSFNLYCVDNQQSAYAVVNGTLTVNGSIGGEIRTVGSNATLNLASATSLSASYTTMTGSYGYSDDLLGRNTYYCSGKSKALFGDIITDVFGEVSGIGSFEKAQYKSYNSAWYQVGTSNTVSYVLNDGSGTVTTDSVNIGETITLTTPTRTGYNFSGWIDNYGNEYDPDIEHKIPIFSNITFTAQWSIQSYTITVIDENGNQLNSVTREYGSIYGDALPQLTKEGYLLSWNIAGTETYITANDTVAIGNHTVQAVWEEQSAPVEITFKDSEGGNADIVQTLNGGSTFSSLPTITRTGYTFAGWYTEDGSEQITVGSTVPEISTVYYAHWSINSYTITFNADGGTFADGSSTYEIKADYGTAVTAPANPTKTGYTFNVWSSTIPSTMPAENLIITAEWKINQYTITFNANGGTFADNSSTYEIKADYGTAVTAPANPTKTGYTFNGWDATIPSTMPAGNQTITAQWTENTSSGCLAAGTLITMADGSQKKVEDVTTDDYLLVFNHETGQYEASKVLFIDYDGWQVWRVVYLEFENGITCRIIYEHGFFDRTLNKYIYIDEFNMSEFVGHEFATAEIDGTTQGIGTTKLIRAYVVEEYTGCYSPTTVYHLNLIADGLLSMPGGIEGMFNFFDYDSETLAYDEQAMQQDIATYGLMTYEDFAEYMSYEVYCCFPAQYIGVSLGKGLMTEEYLQYLIERYVVGMGLEYSVTEMSTTQPTTTDGVETTLPPAVVTGDEDVVEEETTE